MPAQPSSSAPSGDGRSALLVGATGLVGGHVLEALLADPGYGRVRVLARRPTGRSRPKLEERVLDFDRLAERADDVAGDDVFCCLGTTLRTAGSREAFRRVDFDYVARVAGLAAANGARRFLLVSAAGADAGSRVFYNRVKGEAERAVRALPFATVVLLRPSLLLGDRTEHRRWEEAAKRVMPALGPLFVGPLRRWRPVQARDVAAAMVRLAASAAPGVRVVESEEIPALARA